MVGKWKDETGKGYDNHEIVGSEIRLGRFRINIHHYIGCGDQWFASCPNVFNKIPLDGQDIVSLKKQTIEEFKAIINNALSDIPEDLQ